MRLLGSGTLKKEKINTYIRVFLLLMVIFVFLNAGQCNCGNPDDGGDGDESMEDMMTRAPELLNQLSTSITDMTSLFEGENLPEDICEACKGLAETDTCWQICQDVAAPDLSGTRLDSESGYTYSYQFVMTATESTVYYLFFKSDSGATHDLGDGTIPSNQGDSKSESDIELDEEYDEVCVTYYGGESGQKTECADLDVSNTPIIDVSGTPTGEGVTVNGPGEFTIPQGSHFRYQVSATDADCESGCFGFSYTCNPPHSSNFVFDEVTGYIDFTPDQNDIGDYTLQIAATDTESNTAQVVVILHVIDVNDEPEFSLEDITMTEDTPYNFELSDYVTDIDGDTEFSFSGSTESGSHLDLEVDTDGAVTITPDADWHGEEYIKFTVSDGELATEERVKVIVESETDAPYIQPPISPLDLREDFGSKTVNLAPYKKDDEDSGDDLVWSMTSFDEELFEASLTGDTLKLDSIDNAYGEGSVALQLADSEGNTFDYTLPVSIESINDGPELYDIPEINLIGDEVFVLDLNKYVNDPDTDVSQLRFVFKYFTPGLIIDYSSESQTATIRAHPDVESGYRLIEIVVTDYGRTDSQRVGIGWGPAIERQKDQNNPAPVLTTTTSTTLATTTLAPITTTTIIPTTTTTSITIPEEQQYLNYPDLEIKGNYNQEQVNRLITSLDRIPQVLTQNINEVYFKSIDELKLMGEPDTTLAFVKGNKMYLREDNIDIDTIYHELTHVFFSTYEKEGYQEYSNLWEEINIIQDQNIDDPRLPAMIEEAGQIYESYEQRPTNHPMMIEWNAIVGENVYGINVCDDDEGFSVWCDVEDKDSDEATEPKDGFVRPYGATVIDEDIATYVEYIFQPDFFDELTDPNSESYSPKYRQKIDLLKKYGFINQENYVAMIS